MVSLRRQPSQAVGTGPGFRRGRLSGRGAMDRRPATVTDRNDTCRRLGKRLRVLRVTRGWTQENLAEAAGVHRNYIGGVERGEINMSVVNLEKIARGLGVDVGVLFHEG
jgi:DNA-binding XRE family transcriptional regulator